MASRYIPSPSRTVGWDYRLKSYHTKCLLDLTAAQLTGAEFPEDDDYPSEQQREIDRVLRDVLSAPIPDDAQGTSWLMLPNPLEREDLPDDEVTLCARCGRKL